MKKFTRLIVIVPLLMVCSKPSTDEGVVKIGNKTISKQLYESFDRTIGMYPTESGAYFPAFRHRISHLIETELLFNQRAAKAIKDSLQKTDDWKWKKRYFPAQIFFMDFVYENFGIPDEKIKAYYETHKDSFKVVLKGDSATKDSSYYRSLDDVKRQIIDSLFIQENPPDSAFLARFDSIPEQRDVYFQWLQHIRQTISKFFMKKYYKEFVGSPYPDSLSEIFGEGKYITQADMDVIMSWIPETRRHFYSEPEQKRELVEWLVKWKLYSEYAEKLGKNSRPVVKQVLDWGWKLNVVYCYINTVIDPAVRATIDIDSAMMLYTFYDENGYPAAGMDSHGFSNKVKTRIEDMMRVKIDSVIIGLRQQHAVAFLQNDWKDSKNEPPATLLAAADALRDSGKTPEAKEAYEVLTKNFVFTPEGQTALVELAKLQTEQQLYTQAISNYREYLLLSHDHSKRCNTFFMIGFIYDEYLDKPLQAEENYKWVLRNTPDCELADDAEFMMLHLGEPMSSVEELRDEAQRQGRKVDPADEEAPVDTLQTSMAQN